MSAAARQKLHRARVRDGRLVVLLELNGDDLEILFEAGLLDCRSDCHTRQAIAAAVRDYLRLSRNA